MKDMEGKYVAIIGVGVLILVAGLMMPATTTETSRTCIDSPVGPGQDCSETTYETSNPGRGIAIGLGLMVTILGGVLSFGSDSGRNKPRGRSTNTDRPASASQPESKDAASNPQGYNHEMTTQPENKTLAQRVKDESSSLPDGPTRCDNCNHISGSEAIYCNKCGSKLN